MATELDNLLAALMLYRNDPRYTDRLQVYAARGERHAQYALGLVYAEGRGVAVDRVKAYYWLRRAEVQGDPEAQTLRYVVMEQMATGEIAEAEAALADEIISDNTLH